MALGRPRGTGRPARPTALILSTWRYEKEVLLLSSLLTQYRASSGDSRRLELHESCPIRLFVRREA